MIRNLAHTLGSRFIISMLNLALLFITTKWMGAENKGEISLLILNISLVAITSGLFGGPSLVYLIPRYPFKTLLSLNYGWSVVMSFVIMAIIGTGLLPSPLSGWDFFFLALLESLVASHTMILLGKERVTSHNFVQLAKVIITVILLLFFKWSGDVLDFDSFVSAYEIGLLGALIYSLVGLGRSNFSEAPSASLRNTFRASISYGSLVQIGNVAQLLNYRLSFYFLELLTHPIDRALIRIGIYSAALQVAEALWQFARSVSTVQYAKVSNLTDNNEALTLSLLLTKLNAVVTILGVLFLLIIPKSFYTLIFGAEFSEIKDLVILLSPGIIALSMSNAFSHFFAGIGLHKINTQSSVIGLILTIGVGYPSIKYFGTEGAALTATVVYIIQTGYQFLRMNKLYGTSVSSLWISKSDVVTMKDVFRRFRNLNG